MSTGGVKGSSNMLRLTGMATGLDVDTVVSQLMSAEKMPLNRLYQKKQLNQWKTEAYRDIISKLDNFKKNFMDITKPATNMTSPSLYKKFSTTITNSNGVTATAGINAAVGTHTIKVNQLATADKAESTSNITEPMTGTKLLTSQAASLSGTKFNLTLDGVTKEITIDGGSTFNAGTSVDEIASSIQSSINTAFGSNKINVTNSGEKLNFATADTTVNKLTISDGSSNSALSTMGFSTGSSNRINVNASVASLRNNLVTDFTFSAPTGNSYIESASAITGEDLNLTGKKFSMTVDGVTETYEFTADPANVTELANTLNSWAETKFGSNKVSITNSDDKLKFAWNGAGNFSINTAASDDALDNLNMTSGQSVAGSLNFTINGTDFTFNGDATLASIMNNVNSSTTANVTMRYNELNDKISLEAKQYGEGDNLSLSETGGTSFFGALNISTASPVTSQGQDAKVTLDGNDLTRSSNTFAVDGVTYDLNGATEGIIANVSVNFNKDDVFNNIKSFVDSYNEILTTINSKLDEKYDRNYQPLSSEEKEAMSEDDVKRWEDKAKTGLLRNDSSLTSLVSKMRNAVIDGIKDVSTTMHSIGISTTSYSDKGKLTIDETKLRKAIDEDPEGVMNVFAKASTTQPTYSRTLSSSTKTARYNEEGFANKVSDILQDYISTLGDSNSKKGLLIEKAGMDGLFANYKSVLFKESQNFDDQISKFEGKLADKEERYYRKFASLESVMNKYNAQSSWLSSQIGAMMG